MIENQCWDCQNDSVGSVRTLADATMGRATETGYDQGMKPSDGKFEDPPDARPMPAGPVVMEGSVIYEGRIVDLFRKGLQRQPEVGRIENLLKFFPSSVAVLGSEVVGFGYTEFFAPDILQVANVFVQKEYRDCGIGQQIMDSLDRQAASRDYRALILVNSSLYQGPADIRRPTSFYLRAGYEIVTHTSATLVFFKNLT